MKTWTFLLASTTLLTMGCPSSSGNGDFTGTNVTSLADFCTAVAECGALTKSECDAQYKGVADQADAAGCYDAFTAYYDCESQNGACVDGAWDGGGETCDDEATALFTDCLDL